MRVCFLLLALLGLGSLPTRAETWSISQLMGALSKNTEGTATFSETKYIAMLDDPVQSSGELRFVAPDHLEKRTLKPKRELLVLDGGTLTVEQRKRKHVLQLSEYPEVASMIESIRATLAGDRKALEKAYHLALSGSADAWTLQLIPLEAKVGAVVASIKIQGRLDMVKSIEILQADGDRSVMRIDKVAAP